MDFPLCPVRLLGRDEVAAVGDARGCGMVLLGSSDCAQALLGSWSIDATWK